MPFQRLIRLAPWLAAATLSFLAQGAQAESTPTTTVTAQGDFDAVSFNSTIDQVGFSFTLETGYAYTLVLDLNGAFREQTGLIGYADNIKFDGKNATWAILSNSPSTETYRLGLTDVGYGNHWLDLPQINPGQASGAALNLTALRQPITPTPSLPSAPIPEPETYAMMLAGLGTIAWMTRRKRRAT